MTFWIWYGIGFILVWISGLMKHVFYLVKKGRTSIWGFYSPAEWRDYLIFSLLFALAGPLAIYFVIQTIVVLIKEEQRLRFLEQQDKEMHIERR